MKHKTGWMAAMITIAAMAAQAQIASGSATVATAGSGNTVFPEQIVYPVGSPGLLQTRNGDVATSRRELGTVMGFVGSSANGGSYTSPIDGVTTTWVEKDSWLYEGEMFMVAGTSYTFGTYIDDYATIDIDDNQILNQPQCRFTTATYQCSQTGWHKISVKIWDTGGGYGNTYGWLGVAYNTAHATAQSSNAWKQLVDPGDGSLLRTTTKTLAMSGVQVAAQMRESDPTVMDVDYIVYTDPETTPTVNIRALAFEDGERGFATVVRPETFIEGTDANIGDGIAANVAHRLSWKVSSDWATDLAKVKFEVMEMKSGDLLLPDMYFVTIPAAEGHPKTIVSVNDLSNGAYVITEEQDYYGGIYGQLGWKYGRIVGHRPLLNACFWLYASGVKDFDLSNGVVIANSVVLVRHSGFLSNSQYDDINDSRDNYFYSSLNPNAIRYVFGKMGYRLLENSDELAWINECTRLNLQPQQFRQYAVKTVEE